MNIHDDTIGNLGLAMSQFVSNVCMDTQAAVNVPTGFSELDRVCPLMPGHLFVFAAKANSGTSCLAMAIAKNVASGATKDGVKRRVGVFSLDWTLAQYACAITCSHAKVPIRAINDGFVSFVNREKLNAALIDLKNAPIFIDDTSILDISELIERARTMRDRHNIDLFLIDKFTLINGGGGVSIDDNRETYQQYQIAKLLHKMARDLNVPVIVVTREQRDGDVECDEDGIQSPDDIIRRRTWRIKYPGGMQFADALVLLERPSLIIDHPDNMNRTLAIIDVFSDPYAERKTIRLKFEPECMSFTSEID
jgi:replicative DNA helicase